MGGSLVDNGSYRDIGNGTAVPVMSVLGSGYKSEVTITRPANTTAFTAGDAVGVADTSVAANAGNAIHTFAGIGPSGGSIVVTAADLMVYLTAIPAAMTSFRLHLYDASPTAILDNAAWDLLAADRTKYLGYLDPGSPVDVGSTLYVQADQSSKQFQLASGSTSLYGILVTNGGYTPASGEVLKVRLSARAI